MKNKAKKACKLPLLFLAGLLLLTACSSGQSETMPIGTLTPPSYAENQPDENTNFDTPAKSNASSEAPPAQTENDANEAKVYLNGNRLMLDYTPYTENGDVMLPLATVLSYFSRSIDAEVSSGVIKINDADMGTTVEISADSKTAVLNGAEYKFTLTPQQAGGKDIYVEAACFTAMFDCQVQYNDSKSTVYITESGLC